MKIKVPLNSLSVSEASGKPITPEVGDKIDFTGTAKIDRVSGEEAFLTVESVNGAPVDAEMGDEGGESEDEGGMMRMAGEKADAQNMLGY
jgi:hypothetical protein